MSERLGLENVPLLYQYTNINGLEGIITKSELWATNLAYCNDSSEFNYGIAKFIETLRASISVNTSVLENRIAHDLISRLKQLDRSDTYIYCVTKEGNQLSQWRGYGDRGYGYSIGFDFQNLTDQLYGVTSSTWVIYDVEELTEMCRKMSVDIVSALVQSLPTEDANNAVLEITDMVMKDISSGLPFFKHEGFKEEGEYRLYSSVAETLARYPKFSFPVEVRAGQNMLIPYVKLFTRPQGPRQPLPIRRIVVGPKVDFDKAKHSIQLLLKKNGYPDGINIDSSGLPFI